MNILEWIGFIFISCLLFKLGVWIYRTFVYVAPIAKMIPAGSWAVVTGCTSGIGKSFAKELSKMKVNLVLVSRSEEKLKSLSDELESTYDIKTKYLAIDFKEETPEEYAKRFGETVSSISDISLLVNNVGIVNDIPTSFAEQDPLEYRSIVNVNIFSALELTRISVPKMKNGTILNVGSYTGDFPTCYLAVYSATKSFIESWTKALSDELSDKNINVINIKPRYVKTEMTGFKRTSLSIIEPDRLVKDTLKSLGGFLQYKSYSPYFFHAIQIFFTGLLPSAVLSYFSKSAMLAVRRKKLSSK